MPIINYKDKMNNHETIDNHETIKILLSGFQKAIRRGDDLAVKCAIELDKLGEKPMEKLAVISAEDVGRACPTITSYLRKQKSKYELETNILERRKIMCDTVNYFVKQNKSRVADNVNHAYFKNYQPQINESTMEEWKTKFQQLISNNDIDNIDEALKYAAHIFKGGNEQFLLDVLVNETDDEETHALLYYYDYFTKQTRNKTDILFLVNLILHKMLDYRNIQIVDDTTISNFTLSEIEKIASDSIVFPDWVYDKHTAKGKKMGRGFLHFYEESAKLNNCYINDKWEPIAKHNNCVKQLYTK